MEINHFINSLERFGITFFSGVPDSLLIEFCGELTRRSSSNENSHIVAHNEGGSVALASGYHLATGNIPCVYMQNSGIGNALNPVASLTHPKVYGIPMLFVVGWRGEPGTKDEPQHIFQGEATLKLLSDMDIECFIVDKSVSPQQIDDALKHFKTLFIEGKSAAFVICKGAFTGSGYEYKNNFTLTRERAVEIILKAAKNDPVVSTTGKTSRELFEIRRRNNEGHETDFLTVGSMGHSAMIALGIALERPERRIWCLDGDGAVLMHMGSMGIVGSQAPENYVHVVLNNSAHDSVGGMPTAAGKLDLCSIALACGYRNVHKAVDQQSLKDAAELAKSQRGPVFLETLVALGSRNDLGRPNTSPQENKSHFMKYMQ